MIIYEADVRTVYKFREYSDKIKFKDESLVQACLSAARYAKRYIESQNRFVEEHECHYSLGSLRVGIWTPSIIDERGFCMSGSFYAFEWKCDWPSTLEQEIQAKTKSLNEYEMLKLC